MPQPTNEIDRLLAEMESIKTAIAALQGQLDAQQNRYDFLQQQYDDWRNKPENSLANAYIAENYSRFSQPQS